MEVGFLRLQQDCREQGGEFQEVTRRYPAGSWINKSGHWEEVGDVAHGGCSLVCG